MTPNVSRAVWSASRGCWVALHRESGGNLWILASYPSRMLAVTTGGHGSQWTYLRDAEDHDVPLFKDAMMNPTDGDPGATPMQTP